MMAICAALTFSCCSSDDDDDDESYNGQPLTTWSKLVSEDGNDWLNTFPEVPGKFVATSLTTNGMTQVAVMVPEKGQDFTDEYTSKVANTSGFSKVMSSWYEKDNLSVTISYTESQGQKVCMFQFVKNEVSF